MTLNDCLQVCLLAVESRHPHQSVYTNESIVGSLKVKEEGCGVEEMIAFLERFAPSLLMAKAALVLDAQECSIYLPECSAVKPAFRILLKKHTPTLRTPIDQPRPTLIAVG
ncbi:hypothetical protein [Ktedonospora formicarum]|uniref:Uncharacterized protein n=1 Tax=Ktedonospora formicarum TaxID=2778364 RepID=A0A8J3MWK4_9CHLR|nr:hypothetical protein [Ktedonospora formicarum]GHO48748.1 hypothetical protein KSX_69110 [Ktedonospora formicarum]